MSDLILVGDRVLIAPDNEETQTRSGLYLPAGVKEREKVQGGKVVAVGPGYVMPNPEFNEDEPWSSARSASRYLPLQAREGDFAYFMRKEAVEIEYEGNRYLIIPHHQILALLREQPDERDLYR